MTLQHSIRIAAPAAYLFELTQDYSLRLAWDPFLREAIPLVGPKLPSPGARVRCIAWHGLRMDVEYVSYRPPRVAAVRMFRGPWCLRRFAGSWLFRERSPEETLVTFRYHFLVRPGCLTRVAGWLFAHDTRRRLRALKNYAESQRYVRQPLELGLAPN